MSGKRRQATDAEKRKARKLFEQGDLSLADIGKAVGFNKKTISTWSHREGWVRPDGFDDTPSAKKTAAANARNEVLYETNKLDESNRVMRIAQHLSQLVENALERGDVTLALKASTQYGTWLDKSGKLAAELKADNGGRTPTGSDPAEVRRAIAEIADMLLPAD